MRRNLTVVILTSAVLLLIILLALHLHRQSKKEVVFQFNVHQLDLARQLARELESHFRAYSVCLHLLTSLSSVQHHDSEQMS